MVHQLEETLLETYFHWSKLAGADSLNVVNLRKNVLVHPCNSNLHAELELVGRACPSFLWNSMNSKEKIELITEPQVLGIENVGDSECAEDSEPKTVPRQEKPGLRASAKSIRCWLNLSYRSWSWSWSWSWRWKENKLVQLGPR